MQDDNRLKEEILALERRYWQAIQDRDVDTALSLTEDPCVVSGASGVAKVDAAQFRKIMDGAKYRLLRFELGEGAIVRQLTEDVVLLAYPVIEELTVEGAPVRMEAADSSVWVRRDGAWKNALHTESLRGDSFGRDRKPKAA